MCTTRDALNAGLLAVVVMAAASLVGASVQKPIDLKKVRYTGYRSEPADGAIRVYFEDAKGDKTGLSNRDSRFNPDCAYSESVANTNLRYNVRGYNSPFFGDVATKIEPVKD